MESAQTAERLMTPAEFSVGVFVFFTVGGAKLGFENHHSSSQI